MSDFAEKELRQLHQAQEDAIKRMFAAVEKAQADGEWREAEEARDRISEWSYGVEKVRHLLVVLAGGGPSAYLDIELSSSDDVTSVVWMGSWASDPVRIECRRDSGLWEYAEEVAQWIDWSLGEEL